MVGLYSRNAGQKCHLPIVADTCTSLLNGGSISDRCRLSDLLQGVSILASLRSYSARIELFGLGFYRADICRALR